MRPPHILHVTQQLSLGGAGRALIAAVRASRADLFRQTVISLLKPDAIACRLADEAGLAVVAAPRPVEAAAMVAGADIVQFHFWNNVEIHAALDADWPAMRRIVWCHTNGLAPPHLITPNVFAGAGHIVATTAATLALPAFVAAGPERTSCIPGGADLDRVAVLPPTQRTRFTVGYIGALDESKVHPDFVAMSLGAAIPSARFVVCGTGTCAATLRRMAAGSGDAFDFKGYALDIAAEIAGFDVFGYPLRESNFTTTELVLQEVMSAGVPPVVLPHGGAADLVLHGETGLVARDPDDYARCLRELHDDPALRRRLGGNAAQWMRRHAGAQRTANAFAGLYDALLTRPKASPSKAGRSVQSGGAERGAGARRLLESLAGSIRCLVEDGGTAADVASCEALAEGMASWAPLIGDTVLHYRMRYPGDADLACWAGLVLRARGRPALAAAEFARSERCGHACARRYLAAARA